MQEETRSSFFGDSILSNVTVEWKKKLVFVKSVFKRRMTSWQPSTIKSRLEDSTGRFNDYSDRKTQGIPGKGAVHTKVMIAKVLLFRVVLHSLCLLEYGWKTVPYYTCIIAFYRPGMFFQWECSIDDVAWQSREIPRAYLINKPLVSLIHSDIPLCVLYTLRIYGC